MKRGDKIILAQEEVGYGSEFEEKTFQAARIFVTCTKQYYTPEVRGSSVWQISKKYFAGVINGQKSLM